MSNTFDDELRTVVRNLPPAPTITRPSNGRAPTAYDFEELGTRIAEGMLQAAEEQLVQAQNMLEQTKQFAEDMRNRCAGKAAELNDLNNRLRTFGAAIVTAHKVFCGEEEPSKPADHQGG